MTSISVHLRRCRSGENAASDFYRVMNAASLRRSALRASLSASVTWRGCEILVREHGADVVSTVLVREHLTLLEGYERGR